MHVPGLFLTLLSIALIVLKLLGEITWSWWLVLLPVYGPALLGIVAMLLVLSVGALASGWDAWRNRGGR